MRREVVLVNKTRTARLPWKGRANMNDVRVEVRVIFPPQIKHDEADSLIKSACQQAIADTHARLEKWGKP